MYAVYRFTMSSASRQDPRSDEDLVAGCNRGDSAAFEKLYYRYRDWVVRVARRFTGNDDDALDVLQDVFAYLLSKFPGFRLTARMTTFLYPAVKHLAANARRAAGRSLAGGNVIGNVAAPAGAGIPAKERELDAVVGSLPEGQREAVLMRFVDGMSIREIAEALGLPTGTVKSRLHRALETLRADARTQRYFEEK
jgi:RNA polymerase sigma-70 factor (ECF subfamily)